MKWCALLIILNGCVTPPSTEFCDVVKEQPDAGPGQPQYLHDYWRGHCWQRGEVVSGL